MTTLSARLRPLKTATGAIGLTLFLFVLGVAFIGPALAPHSLSETVAAPGSSPSGAYPLGTDALGRDVLSRVLNGGASVLWLASLTTLLVVTIGLAIGLTSGYFGGRVAFSLMGIVDLILCFPPLLLLLLLATGLGTKVPVLVLGVVLVQLPNVARLFRSSTQVVIKKSYVEAAVARGDSPRTILIREVLPNISSIVLADLGIRFGTAVIYIASLNFLGLGLQPPAADWGLMIAENSAFIGINPWSVLAPALMLVCVTLAVNLLTDAYASSHGVSEIEATDQQEVPTAPELRIAS